MKKLIYIVLSITFLISCKKEEMIIEEPIEEPKVLAIGVGHEGGQIFYLEPNGEHGLVARIGGPFVTSGSVLDGTWSIVYESMQWGCPEFEINGADSTSFGSGYQNTIDMLAGCPSSIASYCSNGPYGPFLADEYDDFYIPSRDELELIYQNLNFPDGYYWSSSEYDATLAWRQSFTTGYQSVSLKDNTSQICMIRSF